MYFHDSKRDTRIEIRLDALKHNLKTIISRLEGTRPIAVVKADAYGHGAVPISLKLKEMGINRFAVSNLDEAIELRENGIDNWIQILGPIPEQYIKLLDHYKLTPTLSDEDFGQLLLSNHIQQPVQVKIDTGMGRLGIHSSHAVSTIESFLEKGISIEGLFSHFSSADTDPDFTRFQVETMINIIHQLHEKKIHFKDLHIANSPAIFRNKTAVSPPFSWVRPGLALYGYLSGYNLEEMLSLKTSIVSLKKFSKGDSVSYLRTYRVQKEGEIIAVLPVGYADGLPVSLSNKGFVSINKKHYPIVGRICMDYTLVSLGTQPSNEIQVGSEVCVIGKNAMSIENFANLTNRIPYEATCGMTKRVPRVYL